MNAATCLQTFSTFNELCEATDVTPPLSPDEASQQSKDEFYPKIKKALSASWKASSFLSKIDKRYNGKEYYESSKQKCRIGKDIQV